MLRQMWECMLRQTFHVRELAIHKQVNLLIGPDDVKLDENCCLLSDGQSQILSEEGGWCVNWGHWSMSVTKLVQCCNKSSTI